jgi:hypothetical protein
MWFQIVNFPFLNSNIQATPVYGFIYNNFMSVAIWVTYIS